MPWPCKLENILSGIDITVCHIATARTDMGTHRQRFLHDLVTFEALLRGEARVHSDHCVPSSFSVFTQDVEEGAPAGITDALGQGMVLDQVENVKLVNGDDLVLCGVLIGRLILEISPLTGNLEMRLCRTLGSFTAAMTPLLPSAQRSLLASQGLLRGAIETRVLNGVPLTIRQKGLEANVKTSVRMLALTWMVLDVWLRLTYDEGVPMPISTMYQVNRLGGPL